MVPFLVAGRIIICLSMSQQYLNLTSPNAQLVWKRWLPRNSFSICTWESDLFCLQEMHSLKKASLRCSIAFTITNIFAMVPSLEICWLTDKRCSIGFTWLFWNNLVCFIESLRFATGCRVSSYFHSRCPLWHNHYMSVSRHIIPWTIWKLLWSRKPGGPLHYKGRLKSMMSLPPTQEDRWRIASQK